MAEIAIVECPSCNRMSDHNFTLLLRKTSKSTKVQYIGIISFFMCIVCVQRGDLRSIRIMDEIEVEDFVSAVNDGLYIVDMEDE